MHLLSRISLKDVLGEQPPRREVVKMAHDESIGDALERLAKHNILAAPIMVMHNCDVDFASGQSGDTSHDEEAPSETMIGCGPALPCAAAPPCTAAAAVVRRLPGDYTALRALTPRARRSWADMREILKAFVTTHASKLAQVTSVAGWDAAMDAVALDFVVCYRAPAGSSARV